MTGNQLFESFQFLDDALVEASEARPAGKTVWLRWGAAAAAVVLIAGAALALPRLRKPQPGGVPGTEVFFTQLPQKAKGDPQPGGVPQPVGVPGPDAMLPEGVGSAALHWNDLDESRRGVGADTAGVLMVSEPLIKAQTAACAPEILEAWMAQFDGYAAYFLKDGAGGLAYIELSVVNAAWGGTCTVHIKDRDTPDPASCFVVAPLETDKVEHIGGLTYRAYRLRYEMYPAEPWTELTVEFEKENLEYTLHANVPETRAELAEADLLDLLLCYAGTHNTPDLSQFVCGEHLLRDEELSFAEATADPDFGAYLPAAGPEGFESAQMRRYQMDDSVNYLLAFWFRDRGNLTWTVKQADAEDMARVVDPEKPESYDWNRYPVPWSAYAARENWLTIENPVFRAEDLTPERIGARVHEDDEGLPMCRFGVLFDSGVLVEVNAKDVSAAWIRETLEQLAQR